MNRIYIHYKSTRNMKLLLVLTIVGFTAVLAQSDDFDDSGLQQMSVEEKLELLTDSEVAQFNSIAEGALSRLLTGRPNCLSRVNWGRRFRHNWYITKFWECNRWSTDLHACDTPRLYQPSLEVCVWPWNWRYEPIRRSALTEEFTTLDNIEY